MSNKRSYLDTLNAGRQRRPSSALEELNRSLDGFDQRLDRHRDEASEFLREPARHGSQSEARREADYRYVPPRHSAAEPHGAREIERSRIADDATLGRIATDLRSLRDEVRYQVGTGIRREIDTLRRDMSEGRDVVLPDLSGEFERLAAMINAAGPRADDLAMADLRAELDQVRGVLVTLARDDAERDVRWQALEERLGSGELPDAIASLHQRLAELGGTVARLPEAIPVRAIEEKLRTLATAIDHFSRQERLGSEPFQVIEARLDEIARAIVATSNGLAAAGPIDPAPFERIEARITTLARQIEEVASVDATKEVIERLSDLTQRVDVLAHRADLPEKTIEQLARQIAIVADKIEQAPAPLDPDLIFQGIDERFEILSRLFERRHDDAAEQANLLFRELERRLDEVGDRLDRRSVAGLDSQGMIETIDARLDQFARRMEAREVTSPDDTLARSVESRLAGIEQKIGAAPVAGIDPDIIRNLEAQVAAISAHLMRPGATDGVADVEPRIAGLERAVSENRQNVLDAARQAAEEVVRNFAGSARESEAVKGLAEDLKTLEELTRRSEERNGRTFEAIHDTLLKVVDRLSALEPGSILPASEEGSLASALRMPKASPLTIAEPPSIEAVDTMLPEQDGYGADDGFEEPAPGHHAPDRTPAQAAAAAAVAALGSDDEVDAAPQRRTSLFAGLARRFSRKKPSDAAQAPLADPEPLEMEREADLDEPLDAHAANRPLEPGTGAPDLNAIMRRVRDERQPGSGGEAEPAKSDFIAAARRAAQAAAAEADMLKRQSDNSGNGGGSRLADLVKARRKPILMAAAAIMMALAGLQLGKSFLAGEPRTVAKAQVPAIVQPAKPVAAEIAPSRQTAASGAVTATAPEIAPEIASQAPGDAGQTNAPGLDENMVPAPQAVRSDNEADAEASSAAEGQVAAAMIAEQESATAGAEEAAAKIDAPAIPGVVGPNALREAAAAGDPTALFEIASRFSEGRGVTTDLATAANFYEKSAEAGFAPAQYRTGNFYEKGLGVERDIAKAKTWYQMAAAQGNASAMHNLAVLFAMGADGTTDNDSAARWFLEAAELGVKDSQFNLGILSAKGVGVPQDLEESYKWFALVAKTGDRDAAAKRDEIANALRPEQLERARAATELWQAKPLDPASNAVEVPDAWKQSAPETTASLGPSPANLDMGKAVRNIQALLIKAGYDAGMVDGVMGDKTRNAISAFQRDNGLSATGTVDEALVGALLARN